MFLSPSLRHNSLDNRLQWVSSNNTHFLKVSLASFFNSVSPSDRFLSLSTPSQNSTCWRVEFLLTSSLPNMSLFQPLIFSFITFILVANLKLALPLPPNPCHHPRRRSLNPSTLSHMFSNLNGDGPRLNPPPFSKMGK